MKLKIPELLKTSVTSKKMNAVETFFINEKNLVGKGKK